MELALSIKNTISSISEKVSELQESFLNSTIGQALNTALDTGLRAILPDLIEDEIIEIKDAFLEEGLSEGVSQIVESVKDFGKSIYGLVTGNFENTSQILNVTSDGGVIDTISDLLETVIDKVEDNGIISESIATIIKNQKDAILDSFSDSISSSLYEQTEYIEKLEEYNEEWKTAYENQDLDAMTEAYENIEKYLEKTLVTEETLQTARTIENLQSLIVNNGGSFDLSEEALELAEKLY